MPRVTGYLDRNNVLAGMGFTTYAAYLASDIWAGIKARVLVPGRTGCALCRSRARVVHHHAYTAENLAGVSLAGMYPLCFGCHETVEHGRGGRKLSFPAVRRKFAALLLLRKAAGAAETPKKTKPRWKRRGKK